MGLVLNVKGKYVRVTIMILGWSCHYFKIHICIKLTRNKIKVGFLKSFTLIGNMTDFRNSVNDTIFFTSLKNTHKHTYQWKKIHTHARMHAHRTVIGCKYAKSKNTILLFYAFGLNDLKSC